MSVQILLHKLALLAEFGTEQRSIVTHVFIA